MRVLPLTLSETPALRYKNASPDFQGGSDHDTEMQDVPAELAGVPKLAAANHGAAEGQSMADIADLLKRRVTDKKLRSTT